MPKPNCSLSDRFIRPTRQGMALPVVIMLFSTLSVGIFLLSFLTREETGQTQKFILDTKARSLAEAIHFFLVAKAYSTSWKDRTFNQRLPFGKTDTSDPGFTTLRNSIGKMYEADPFLESNLVWRGYLKYLEKDDKKVIIIYIMIDQKNTGKNLCRFYFFELYKRDMLDTIGEGVSLFVDGTETKTVSADDEESQLLQRFIGKG